MNDIGEAENIRHNPLNFFEQPSTVPFFVAFREVLRHRR